MVVLEKEIRDLLVEHGEQRMGSDIGQVKFTEPFEANALVCDLKNYPHAYVIACVMDRQIKAEIAWAIPYRLKERIGSFEFEDLFVLSEASVNRLFNQPSPLHRYTDKMASCLYSAIQRIGNDYSGDASQIWSDTPTSAGLVYRFLQFHGVGPKIATMAANILVRNFKIKLQDYYSIDISADVHVRRVFVRLGLTEESASNTQVIYRARAMHPEFPGLLDYASWEIGREWCRPKNPACGKCYMQDVCPSGQAG